MPGMLLALRFANPDVSQRISPVGWCYLFGGMFVIFDFCCVHVLSSGLAPRAAFGGQNFSVRARGCHWVYPPVDIRAHSNVCAKVNSDIVSDDFWCVSVRCWASHFVLHWLSFRFRQGSPRQRIVPPRSRTHVWIYNYIIYIWYIISYIYIYKYICSIQILQSCTFLAKFLFQQCLKVCF